MYLRHTIRKKDGKVHRYWSLVRSVRVGRRVIQQTVAHLGELDEAGRMEARGLARHLIGSPEGHPRRALAAVWRCLSGAGIVAWDGARGSVRAAAAAGSGAHLLGEDG